MVYLFQPRFVGPIESGSKLQTIRARGKRRPPRAGESLSLRAWSGAAYRSPQRPILETVCASVDPIEITDGPRKGRTLDIAIGGEYLPASRYDGFARLDGFADAAELIRWYHSERSVPFEGWLIRWPTGGPRA